MKKKVLVLILLTSLLILWEFIATNSSTVRYFVSSPSESYLYANSHALNLLNSTLVTLIEALSGYVLAIIFSFLIMFICFFNKSFFNFISPLFIASQVLPIITLAPFFIIVFGMGLFSKIAMVVLMCFFPIFVNFSTGYKSITSNTYDLLYIYNAKKIFTIFRIILPLSTPYIFAGLKVSTTMAIMGAIIAEFVGAKDGLGKNLYLAPKNSQPELMICSIILTAILGWSLYKLVELSEMKFGKWYKNNKIQNNETFN